MSTNLRLPDFVLECEAPDNEEVAFSLGRLSPDIVPKEGDWHEMGMEELFLKQLRLNKNEAEYQMMRSKLFAMTNELVGTAPNCDIKVSNINERLNKAVKAYTELSESRKKDGAGAKTNKHCGNVPIACINALSGAKVYKDSQIESFISRFKRDCRCMRVFSACIVLSA